MPKTTWYRADTGNKQLKQHKKSLTQKGKAFSFTFQPKNKTCVLLNTNMMLETFGPKNIR